MKEAELDQLKAMAADARSLAQSDHVMIRIAGERIAVIIADVLYEIDPGLDAVTPLLPEYRR